MNLLVLPASERLRLSHLNPLTTDPMWDAVTFLLDLEDMAVGYVTAGNFVKDRRHGHPITQFLGSGAPEAVLTEFANGSRGKVLQFPANNNSRFVVENQGNVLGIDGGLGSFTMDYWVKGKTPTDAGQSIIASADAPFTYMSFKENVSPTAGFYVDLSNGWQSLMSTIPSIYDNSYSIWHHIAIVFDRGNNQIRLYIDGAQVATLNNYLNQLYIDIPSLTIGRYNDFVKSRSIHKLRLTNAVRFNSAFNVNDLVY